MAGSRRAYPLTAISVSASGTVTSWPDIRRPLKAAAPGAADRPGERVRHERQPDARVEDEAGVEAGDADGDGHEVVQVREGRPPRGDAGSPGTLLHQREPAAVRVGEEREPQVVGVVSVDDVRLVEELDARLDERGVRIVDRADGEVEDRLGVEAGLGDGEVEPRAAAVEERHRLTRHLEEERGPSVSR